MAVSDASRDRYSSSTFEAAYLETEWGDVLLEIPNGASAGELRLDQPIVLRMYAEVVRRLANTGGWPADSPLQFADIGGATGRTVYEWLRRFPRSSDVVLVEPSAVFVTWARRLLLQTEVVEWIPIVDTSRGPAYARPLRLPQPLENRSAVRIYDTVAERVPRPAGYFDAITCLNVVDRHREPQALVTRLGELLKPGTGVLAFASPMDWLVEFTPEAQWCTNLRELFKAGWEVIENDELSYDFRYSKRKASRFGAQLIIARRLG